MRPTLASHLLKSRFCLALAASVALFSLSRLKAETENNRAPLFRLNVPSHPTSLDPRALSPGQLTHIHFNLFARLLKLEGLDQLKPDLASKCEFKKIKPALFHNRVLCHLDDKRTWSDGKPIIAGDVVTAFQSHFQSQGISFATEQLMTIAGAKEALALKQPDRLAIKAIDLNTIEFSLAEPDADFLYRLAQPALSIFDPTQDYSAGNAEKARYTGAYQVVSWQPDRRLVAQRRESATADQKQTRITGAALRVEFLNVDDDETAMNLYRANSLEMVRRVPSHYSKSLTSKPDFYKIPIVRGDYLGFGPELIESPLLREALTLALNYKELATLYDGRGRPGCPSQELNWYEKPSSAKGAESSRFCLKFDLKKAKALLAQSKSNRESVWRSEGGPKLVIHFSKAGGDDIARGMEWKRNQWKKNLGLDVELQSLETGALTQLLRTKPPTIFRRGISATRPTCLATLESFESTHPDRFTGFKSSRFDDALKSLRRVGPNSTSEQRTLCNKALSELIHSFYVIPQGQIHFMMLVRSGWTGWTLNGLNHLDLSALHLKPSN